MHSRRAELSLHKGWPTGSRDESGWRIGTKPLQTLFFRAFFLEAVSWMCSMPPTLFPSLGGKTASLGASQKGTPEGRRSLSPQTFTFPQPTSSVFTETDPHGPINPQCRHFSITSPPLGCDQELPLAVHLGCSRLLPLRAHRSDRPQAHVFSSFTMSKMTH